MVGYDSTGRAVRRPRLTAMNVEVGGQDDALPDSCGLPVVEPAAFMNEARRCERGAARP